jgi:hypothetical protein
MDHSQRVSARENVQAFYAWVGRGRDGFGAWRTRRPMRRFLRTCDVVTFLSVAGVVLSVGALMVLVGLGEAQIAASEGHTADLFGRTLFDVGLGVALLGIFIVSVAVSANQSQAAARRGFPDIRIGVYGDGVEEASESRRVLVPTRGFVDVRQRVHYFTLLITNAELSRPVNLMFTLRHDLVPAADLPATQLGEWFFTRAEGAAPPIPDMDDVDCWTGPVHIEPQRSVTGLVVFDVSPPMGDAIVHGSFGDLIVTDTVSTAQVRLAAWPGNTYAT